MDRVRRPSATSTFGLFARRRRLAAFAPGDFGTCRWQVSYEATPIGGVPDRGPRPDLARLCRTERCPSRKLSEDKLPPDAMRTADEDAPKGDNASPLCGT